MVKGDGRFSFVFLDFYFKTKEAETMKVDQNRRWNLFVVAGATMALVAGMASTVPSAYAGRQDQGRREPVDFPRNGNTYQFQLAEDGSASRAQ